MSDDGEKLDVEIEGMDSESKIRNMEEMLEQRETEVASESKWVWLIFLLVLVVFAVGTVMMFWLARVKAKKVKVEQNVAQSVEVVEDQE